MRALRQGLFSPVTGLPLQNALLIPHQAMAAAAAEAQCSSQWGGGSLMGRGYTASLRASKALGAAQLQTTAGQPSLSSFFLSLPLSLCLSLFFLPLFLCLSLCVSLRLSL